MMNPYKLLVSALLAMLLAACAANSGPAVTKSATSTTVTTATTAKQAPVVVLAVSPADVTTQQTATATWSSENATSCVSSGAWSGAEALDDSAGWTIPAESKPGTYIFSMTCTGPGGTTTATETLLVGQVPPPTIQMHLSPAQVQPGSAASITWASSNTAACTGTGGTGSDGWAAPQPTNNLDGFTVPPITVDGQYPYNLTCTGPGGTSQQTAILTVATSAPAAPPLVTFAATPTVIAQGGTTQLTWLARNSTSCVASGGSGSDSWGGSQAISSSGTQIGPLNSAGDFSYTLTCAGPGGTTSDSIDVAVGNTSQLPPVTVTIAATPSTIIAGQSAALTWSSANANACTTSGSWSGTQPTSGTGVSTGTLTTPGVYSFSIDCTGNGGSQSSTDSATVTVNPAPAAVVSFNANPTSLTTGHSLALSWNSSGATGCTASGGTGGDGWNGAVVTSDTGMSVGPINTTGSYTYTLTCNGPGGPSAPTSINVTVSSAPTAASVVSFKAMPSTLQAGNATTLTWSSNSATDCSASGGTGTDGWTGSVGPSSSGTSTGALAAGTYTYTLTCTGPGGTSGPVSVTVNVSSTPPPAAVVSFTAAPTAVQTGQSSQLSWSTSNATGCTASDGTGSDGWGGSVATSSSGTSVTITTDGSYTYALTCTGPGGASAAATLTVTATAAPPIATVDSFSATPSSIQTGQSTSLAWTSSNATSCTPSGGASGDGWASAGSVATSSSGMTVGPINAAGSYTYTLTCTGAGGASSPSTLTVTVTTAPPAASVSSLTASPTSLLTGQSTLLSWSSSNATSCSASGGSGTDGWNGSVGTSSSGTTVGPLNAAGTYIYTLACTGPGGTSSPSSVSVTVSAPPARPAFQSFAATPSTVNSGQSSSLSWATSGATSCVASGGTGSDGWPVGTIGTSSAATVVSPAATTTYTLVCSGPGGTSVPQSTTVTVVPAVPGQPTVALAVNGGSTAQIQPGSAPTLTWSTTNATSCTASGGTGADGWSGSQPTSSSGATLNAISTPGVYSYTLTCIGAGGTTSSSVTLTVISSTAANCGIGQASTLLETPAATASSSLLQGICVLGCGVQNVANVINASKTDFAQVYTNIGVGVTLQLKVTDQTTTYPAGRTIGFLTADSTKLLSLSLLSNVSVVTYLGSTVQETATVSNLLQLQALGTLFDPNEGYVAFKTTKPFNSVALQVNSLAGVINNLKVYGACATLQ